MSRDMISHQIGPLGRFGVLVAMSVCLFDVPFPCDFHQLGPVGRVGLVVAMSVCVFVYLFIYLFVASRNKNICCYYLHRSRYSVSPVCRIFSLFFGQTGGASQWRVCYQLGLPRLAITVL